MIHLQFYNLARLGNQPWCQIVVILVHVLHLKICAHNQQVHNITNIEKKQYLSLLNNCGNLNNFLLKVVFYGIIISTVK